MHPAGHIRELPTNHRLRSEEHTSELQSQSNLVCRLLLEKKKDRISDDYVSLSSKLVDCINRRLFTHTHTYLLTCYLLFLIICMQHITAMQTTCIHQVVSL